MVSTLQGWQGYVRIKLENESNNWSLENISNVSNAPTYPKDPYVMSAPFDTDVAMEHIYVIGTKTAIDTKDGVMEVTGSIERPLFEDQSDNEFIWNASINASTLDKPYWNTSHYTLADVAGLYGTNVSECAMMIKPADNQTFVLHNVRFHSYSFGLAKGEVTTESCDFAATNISTS